MPFFCFPLVHFRPKFSTFTIKTHWKIIIIRILNVKLDQRGIRYHLKYLLMYWLWNCGSETPFWIILHQFWLFQPCCNRFLCKLQKYGFNCHKRAVYFYQMILWYCANTKWINSTIFLHWFISRSHFIRVLAKKILEFCLTFTKRKQKNGIFSKGHS